MRQDWKWKSQNMWNETGLEMEISELFLSKALQ